MILNPRRIKMILAVLGAALLLTTVPFAAAQPPGQGSGPVVIVNTPYLHQRTGAGPEYVVQGIHAGGAFLPVVGRTEDRSWWQVQTQFGVGWVINDHVLTQGNFSGVPIVTEFGILDRPKAIVVGYPIPVYALPNPGSVRLGLAPSEAQYPIVGRAYHTGTEIWYWLVETEAGLGWLSQEETAVYGFSRDFRTYSQEEARDLPRGAVDPDGVVNPPPPQPIPPVPVAPPLPVAPPPVVDTTTPDTTTTGETSTGAVPATAALPAPTPTPIPPPEVYRMNVTGDCYALPLVGYLIQHSPVRATRLICSNSAAGRDAVILGEADLGIVINGECGVASQVPVATLFAEDGTPYGLSFCVAGPGNQTVQRFLNWLATDQGRAAVRLYRGLPGSNVPASAAPAGG